ncbi:hypothetical protein LCGC14_2811530 [marine sediment metagenome]|uniref:Uncharacterized protein n=1 Tax=marine sediment metagenome TaxID=412755 RepID=A0A0F8YJP8_9ZZZZ
MPDKDILVTEPVETPPPEVSVASAIIPYARDTTDAMYLGYRACGFSTREATKMIKRSATWLSLRRRDPVFKDLEHRIPEFRKELSKEYVELEFFRNFRLVLEKDYKVLMRSLEKVDKEHPEMSKQEQEYLIKLRSQYTPQQMQILEGVVSSIGDGFNFARWVAEHQEVVQVSRTDTVTVIKE